MDVTGSRNQDGNSSSSTSSSSPRSEGREWKSLARWAMTRSSSSSVSSSLSSGFLKEKSDRDVSSSRPELSPLKQPSPRRTFWGQVNSEESRSQVASAERKRQPDSSPPSQPSPKKIIHAKSEHKAERQSPRKLSFLIPPDSPDRTPRETLRLMPLATPRPTPQRAPQQASPRTSLHEGTVSQLRGAQERATHSPKRSSRASREHRILSPQLPATPHESPQRSLRHEEAGQKSRQTAASAAPLSQTVQRSTRKASKIKAVGRHSAHQTSASQEPLASPRKQGAPKRHKRRPVGYQVRREIKLYRSSTKPLIPRLAFARAVREILWQVGGADYRMQKLALQALHEAGEAVIVGLLEGSNLLAHHARRVTIMNKDLATLLSIIRSYGGLQRCLA